MIRSQERSRHLQVQEVVGSWVLGQPLQPINFVLLFLPLQAACFVSPQQTLPAHQRKSHLDLVLLTLIVAHFH